MKELSNTPVLIVDDFEAMRRLVRMILLQIGFTQIELAADGTSALELVRKNSYGLIISDLAMKPMSGLALLQEVRRDTRLGAVPFIMITAHGDAPQVVAAKKAGANDYIVKPFTTEIFQRKVMAVLDHSA